MVLTATPAGLDRAERMGTRRGVLFVDDGIPTPNPFDQDTHPDYAQAWRRGYLAEVAKANPNAQPATT